MSEAQYHDVRVVVVTEDEGSPDAWTAVSSVTFTCTAPEDAECRTHPTAATGCDCEQWHWSPGDTHDEAGHERIPGQECWAKPWFDDVHTRYIGEDADDMRDDYVPRVARRGPVEIGFDNYDEILEWKWAE